MFLVHFRFELRCRVCSGFGSAALIQRGGAFWFVAIHLRSTRTFIQVSSIFCCLPSVNPFRKIEHQPHGSEDLMIPSNLTEEASLMYDRPTTSWCRRTFRLSSASTLHFLLNPCTIATLLSCRVSVWKSLRSSSSICSMKECTCKTFIDGTSAFLTYH